MKPRSPALQADSLPSEPPVCASLEHYGDLVAKSCLILATPMGGSPPGFSVHRILQARILEWVAISFTRGIFPTQGAKPGCPALQADSLPTELQGKPPWTLRPWSNRIFHFECSQIANVPFKRLCFLCLFKEIFQCPQGQKDIFFPIYSSKIFKLLLFEIRSLTHAECIYVNNGREQPHFGFFSVWMINGLSTVCWSLAFPTDL